MSEPKGIRLTIDEEIALMRARWRWKDELTDAANKAFDEAFRAAMKKPMESGGS